MLGTNYEAETEKHELIREGKIVLQLVMELRNRRENSEVGGA